MSTLFYIIGASGVGKDSLINYCRARINGSYPIAFAHRYITRPIQSGAENHIYLSDEEFNLRLQYQLFAMTWESHQLQYGIGIEINSWLQQGLSVVINGSREYLPTALQGYPQLKVILIEAQPEVLKTRLQSRGRENDHDIMQRLLRNQQLSDTYAGVVRIQNNGLLADAAGELLQHMLAVKEVI